MLEPQIGKTNGQAAVPEPLCPEPTAEFYQAMEARRPRIPVPRPIPIPVPWPFLVGSRFLIWK